MMIAAAWCISVGNSGCAQIGAISGGLKDSLPPVLVYSTPKLLSTNISSNKISLTFDEYVEVQELQNNLIVSPLPKITPEVNYKLKTVSIKIKDTLLPNTTYALNFGNAIRDVNEGNPFKNFTYVFSTGNHIDSLTLSGKVKLAESDKVDSTIIVMLYRNANDSSVKKQKPNYIARVNSNGSFTFTNLPDENFSIYALKDGDGGKTYNSKNELFAFTDQPVKPVAVSDTSLELFAYAEEKDTKIPGATTTVKPKTAAQKKLRLSTKVASEKQDLRNGLVLDVNNNIKSFDSTKIVLTDTNYVPIAGVTYLKDSNKITLNKKWDEDVEYRLIITKNAIKDISDSTINKTDTIHFKTKKVNDYGNVVIRFSNIDLKKNPVLQFVQGDDVKESFPVTANEWKYKLFPPGEYDIRILYDDNKNGKWDPGNYSKKIQPEKVIALPKKFSIRENWDNESEIAL
jgi:aspartate 1-decarboxylase